MGSLGFGYKKMYNKRIEDMQISIDWFPSSHTHSNQLQDQYQIIHNSRNNNNNNNNHKVISKSLQERAFRVQIKALCKLAFHIMYSLLRVIANKINLSLFPDMGNDISF